MQQVFFSADGWASWDTSGRPVVPEGMPMLVDDDLLFEDADGPRATVVVNRWLRELPSSGCPAPKTWKYYAQVLRAWLEHLRLHDTGPFDDRARLKSALSSYAVYRATGPLDHRFEATTWNQHMSVLSSFYRWAVAETFAPAEPFTYKQAVSTYGDQVRVHLVNQATRRVPKPHVTIRYLAPDFVDLFLKALSGLRPDGSEDERFAGRELMRNTAVTRMALSAGLRCQEFTYLLAPEVPALPPRPTAVPIPFPVPQGLTKGRKFRTSWIDYEALAEVHRYLSLDRPLYTDGSRWRPPRSWGEPLIATEVDPLGGRVNGQRMRWASMRPSERRRLVAAGGGSMLIAVQPGGGPFTAWATVFRRTSIRVRTRFEPRFPHVEPHRLRHTFAMATMEKLVRGYYSQVAGLVRDADADAAWILYLKTVEPLLILRDLLGHSSVLTTEKYLSRLDMTRIFKDAYEHAGREHGLLSDLDGEVDEEFDDVEVS